MSDFLHHGKGNSIRDEMSLVRARRYLGESIAGGMVSGGIGRCDSGFASHSRERSATLDVNATLPMPSPATTAASAPTVVGVVAGVAGAAGSSAA